MSLRVSRAFGWVYSACLFALLPAASAQATPTPPPPATTPTTTVQGAPPEAPAIARYENKYEISGGLAYDHLHASPPVTGGANLGGFNIMGTGWFFGPLGLAASVRGYYGTTPTIPNTLGPNGQSIDSPFVSQYFFLGGPELRGPRNQYIATSIHTLFGGVHGTFDSDLKGVPPQKLGIIPSQNVFASAIGGSLDINHSPRLAYRVTPELIITHYNGVPSSTIQYNFGFTAGILWRFQ